jgi:deoxycytidine triphosphate deaminase
MYGERYYLLSDKDISDYLNKEIVIEPFNEDNLTPLGYNLSPSNFVFSLKKKELIQEENAHYKICANDTVLILTSEAVWVSKKIAGTFHSKVGVVSNGFGHISTTLDPNWIGPLLISLNNPTNMDLLLPSNKTFVTLIFYKLKSKSMNSHDNAPSRTDIIRKISDEMLQSDLSEKQRGFISKASEIFTNENIHREFTEKVNRIYIDSNTPILSAIKASRKLMKFNYLKYIGFKLAFWIISLALFLRAFIYFKPIEKLDLLLEIDKGTFMALIAILFGFPQIIKKLREDIN